MEDFRSRKGMAIWEEEISETAEPEPEPDIDSSEVDEWEFPAVVDRPRKGELLPPLAADRWTFLNALDECPDVVRVLRRNVWPAYKVIALRDRFAGLRLRRWNSLVRWAITDPTAAELRSALLAWAEGFRLDPEYWQERDTWLLDTVLCGLGRVGRKGDVGNLVLAGPVLDPLPPVSPDESRFRLDAAGWRPPGRWAEYEKSLDRAYAAGKKAYRAAYEAKAIAAGWVRVKETRSDALHFRWLARYQTEDVLTADLVGVGKHAPDPSAVRHALKKTAARIGLILRPRRQRRKE
jgi:hypothetical protein